MLNPYYLTDRAFKVGFKMNLDSHHINHANSKLTILPNYLGFGIETICNNKIQKEMAHINARIINQYIFRYQTVFSATFDKQDEDNQVLDETELFLILNIIQNSTQTDIDNIDVISPLEYQIQQREMKDSGRRFDKIISITIYFYKTGELICSNYVKFPLRSNAILNIENNDKNCFIWSVLAWLHPCNITHPNRVSNYKQNFNEFNINGFNISNGFKCSDVHRFNELNNLSVNTFEINFYQNQNKWRHKLIPIEISKNISDRLIDLGIYKNHYILIKN